MVKAREQAIGRPVTQPRIFVTYVPAPRPTRQSRALHVSRAKDPALAVLAGALLAGGAVHAFGSLQSGGGSQPQPGRLRPLAAPQWRPAPDALPYLAVASIELPPPAVRELPAELAPAKHEPAAQVPPPIVRPRQDLAGFLEDRGLPLATAAGPALPELSGLADTSQKPATELAAVDTALPIVPPSAVAVTASAEAAPETPAAAETQSFPTVTVGGQALGAVTMRGGKIHLASLVGLLQLKLPASEFARLSSAPAADSFVDVEALGAAGIDAVLDSAGERLTLSAR